MTAAALVIDIVLTLVFAIIGRASHAEALDVAGVLGTWWPFLVALLVGWIVSLAWRAPLRIVRSGIPIWIITVAGGMLLRVVSGQGTALPFIIVATIALGVFLLGWRGIAAAVAAVRRRSAE
ncbi:Protein of unknown function [Paramicrobacterium humi]|uniref:DUF3054 domain-containing protein n=1 Tax=Paramicrobacterium humi TaxID=640635 RepID=A0A1H4JNC9_9MICO|nr:DUF3054 domain-containing protein [Microbacterium humi]SEB47824.1 Protein of unknown function [Microbacterium humi]